jgi:two-component system sensor histidine kinase RstB
VRGLFLRIYAALAAVLVLGLLLAGTLRSQRTDTPWDGAVTAFAGFPSAAASALGRAAPNEQDDALATLSERFGHPVRLMPREAVYATISEVEHTALVRGESLPIFDARGATLHVPLAGQPFLVSLGPVPRPSSSPPRLMFLLIGALMALAVVVSWWLRPLQTQLEGLVQTADALGAGHLDARSRLPAHDPLGPLSHALDHMADRVQVSIRDREALIAEREALLHAVSHELRSPLQRMRFGLELLDGEDDRAAFAERLGELEGDIDQLDALVGELLDWARATSPASDLETVSIVDLVQPVVADAQRLRPGLSVTLHGTTGPRPASAHQLERALANLVSNAARWSTHRVEVRLQPAAIEVHDDGPGVPEADRTRIFHPFVRLDPARSRDAGGVGLGLALTARIAGQHGAEVTVSDSDLGGACFVWRWEAPAGTKADMDAPR